MKSMTRQKDITEVAELLEGVGRVYLIGCGNCATLTRTGGIDEVKEMREQLQNMGKMVTGWTVIPVACDEMTGVSLRENEGSIRYADAMLILTCALGVQRVASYIDKPVIPALDTLFIGLEKTPGVFQEACDQCGQCILGWTAGICPITACHKHLLNGPCGGTNNGKCEVDPTKDCAWTLIYEKLKEQGRLDLMKKYQPIRNSQVVPRPRISVIS